jgi:hypothetical protein
MLKNIVEVKKEETPVFQVLFLDNEGSQVEVHEAGEVDFLSVQRHLDRGQSVFITSKNTQKVPKPKETKPRQSMKSTRWVTAYYFTHV